MRVLIADDHPFIRKGIRETLADAIPRIDITEARDGNTAYDLLISQLFDLAIVDISMPGRGGLELIRDILTVRPGMRFLVISVYPEREFAERAYREGALGYLAKESAPSEFLHAVHRILGGKLYVSPEYAETLVRTSHPKAQERARLSDRELTILSYISEGKSLTEIGSQLHLSVKTVSTYKSRVMDKLGLANNAELIAYALARAARPPSP